MTHEILKEIAERVAAERVYCDCEGNCVGPTECSAQVRHDLAVGYLALSVKLEEAERQRTYYYDLGHNRTCQWQIVKAKLEEAQARIDALEGAMNPQDVCDATAGLEASRGEVIKACPRCGNRIDQRVNPNDLSDGLYRCDSCGHVYNEHAYYRRCVGPTA